MLNSKSRIVLSSLSALGLIGAGVVANHVDADLFNNASDVKTPTVKAESKKISDSKKSDVQPVTTYSAPAATIGSTIGSEIATTVENKTTDVSDYDAKVEQNVEPVVESESVDTTESIESEQNVVTETDSVVDNNETNNVPDVAPTVEPVVEHVSDCGAFSASL